MNNNSEVNHKKNHEILDVPFSGLTRQATLETLFGFLASDRNHMVVTPNPEALMIARRNRDFLSILQNADLVLPDGIGIILAAKWRKIPIRNRVTGCDITSDLLSATKGRTCYILGSAPGIADAARDKLIRDGINVVGSHHGYFHSTCQDNYPTQDNSPSQPLSEENKILSEIRDLKPDILLIGMGMPRQEEWAAANLHTLPCRITLCIGGTIDILAGKVKRAPKVFRYLGIEWLYRLIIDPSRLRRMLDLPRFVWAVFTEPKQTFHA